MHYRVYERGPRIYAIRWLGRTSENHLKAFLDHHLNRVGDRWTLEEVDGRIVLTIFGTSWFDEDTVESLEEGDYVVFHSQYMNIRVVSEEDFHEEYVLGPKAALVVKNG